MKLKLLIGVLVFSCFLANAQYTNVINSNKPGFSESPYSVGTGIYQFESSFFFRNLSIEPTFSQPQSLGVDVAFRTSFFLDKFELNANVAYQKDKIAFKNIFTSQEFTTGIRKLTVGGKYLVYEQEYEDKSKEIRSWKRRYAFDWKRLIPSVGVYAGANLDFVNDIHKVGTISPRVGVLLQNNLTSDFHVITNIFYDKIGTDFAELSFVITSTYNLSDRLSTYFENQSATDKFKTSTNFGTGFAFLYTPNLQINTSARMMFEGEATGFYASVGVSYRINKYRPDYIEYDDEGNVIAKNGKSTNSIDDKNKGFFGKLFDKVNVFKKKKRTRPKRKRKKPVFKASKKKKGVFGSFLKKKKKTEDKKEDKEDKEDTKNK